MQSDRIGRISAYWAFVNFRQFLKLAQITHIFWDTFFHATSYVLSLTKKWLGDFLGDFRATFGAIFSKTHLVTLSDKTQRFPPLTDTIFKSSHLQRVIKFIFGSGRIKI
jgi:hypothetical protein